MANAKKCDLCGKFYATDDAGCTRMSLMKYNSVGILEDSDYYDICTECSKRILQKGEEPKEVTCATCGISDLNCHEQCKEK